MNLLTRARNFACLQLHIQIHRPLCWRFGFTDAPALVCRIYGNSAYGMFVMYVSALISHITTPLISGTKRRYPVSHSERLRILLTNDFKYHISGEEKRKGYMSRIAVSVKQSKEGSRPFLKFFISRSSKKLPCQKFIRHDVLIVKV